MCDGAVIENNADAAEDVGSLLSLYMTGFTDYIQGWTNPFDLSLFIKLPEDGENRTAWFYPYLFLAMAGLLFVSMFMFYAVFFGVRACCRRFKKRHNTPTIAIDQFRDD